MRVAETYEDWTEKRLSPEAAASLRGVCPRTFRRYGYRLEEASYEGLLGRRMSEGCDRKAPVEEVMPLAAPYRRYHAGWNVRHYYAW